MLRILHVGIGPTGQRIEKELLARSELRTVAAVDLGPAIGGRLMSELVEDADPTLRIESSLERIHDWSSIDVALVTTSSTMSRCAEVFRPLLARGLPVVSTCEELVYPWIAHRELATELDLLAKRHGGRLLGTGVNPGFLMDTFPVFATALARRVDAIEVVRRQDATARRITFQRKIGVGLSVADFAARVAEGTLRHVGFAESAHLVATTLGFEIEGWRETVEPVIAERAHVSSLGAIEPGAAAGMRQIGELSSGGKVVVRLEFVAAIDQPGAFDSVRIRGEPELEFAIPGGVPGDVAVTSIALNSLATLVAAPPGLHTMVDLPPVHYRRFGRVTQRA
ncbi:MAG: dihydrodipicolinate reductase [Planctomycetes bacterium]|nr:dihydrodipicolinate reductase [Planctomycetota bacterium]